MTSETTCARGVEGAMRTRQDLDVCRVKAASVLATGAGSTGPSRDPSHSRTVIGAAFGASALVMCTCFAVAERRGAHQARSGSSFPTSSSNCSDFRNDELSRAATSIV